jgi:hypothetical protein
MPNPNDMAESLDRALAGLTGDEEDMRYIHWLQAGADKETARQLAKMDLPEGRRVELLNMMQPRTGRQPNTQQYGQPTYESYSMSYRGQQQPAMERQGAQFDYRQIPWQPHRQAVETPYGPAGGDSPQNILRHRMVAPYVNEGPIDDWRMPRSTVREVR